MKARFGYFPSSDFYMLENFGVFSGDNSKIGSR